MDGEYYPSDFSWCSWPGVLMNTSFTPEVVHEKEIGLPQEGGGLLSYLYTSDLPYIDKFNSYRDVVIDGVCRPVLVATKLIPFDCSLKVIHFNGFRLERITR